MKKNDKMWALLLHLSGNFWWLKKYFDEIPWDDELWDKIVDETQKAGFNTIILDIGDGIEFASHPEIAVKNAWNRTKVRKEIAKCREKGIKLIPKLNFSTTHDRWLGEYARMVSTATYYRVCNDLIKETYELFEHPEYIHIGMDEENNQLLVNDNAPLVIYRRGELLWHDLRFLVDCVKDTGAKPWIWHDILFDEPEEFKKHFEKDEILISPWHYRSFKEEHYTPIPPEEKAYFPPEQEYIETGEFFVKFRKWALPLGNEGFQYVPTVSVCMDNKYNSDELMEYFEEGMADENIIGYMTAPWCQTIKENEKLFVDSFKTLAEARKKFYK